jgi:hypothetical protein
MVKIQTGQMSNWSNFQTGQTGQISNWSNPVSAYSGLREFSKKLQTGRTGQTGQSGQISKWSNVKLVKI